MLTGRTIGERETLVYCVRVQASVYIADVQAGEKLYGLMEICVAYCHCEA